MENTSNFKRYIFYLCISAPHARRQDQTCFRTSSLQPGKYNKTYLISEGYYYQQSNKHKLVFHFKCSAIDSTRSLKKIENGRVIDTYVWSVDFLRYICFIISLFLSILKDLLRLCRLKMFMYFNYTVRIGMCYILFYRTKKTKMYLQTYEIMDGV